MAQERKNSVPTTGTLRDISVVLEKKIRNLEKRKGRLELVEKELELGKEVPEDRKSALLKKECVHNMLDLCRDFLTTAAALQKNEDQQLKQKAKREQRELQNRMIDTFANALHMQWIVQEANLRKDELASLVDSDCLKAIEKFVNVYECYSKKDARKSAEMWINCVEAKSREAVPGVSYKELKEKLTVVGEALDKLNNTQYVGVQGSRSVCEQEHGDIMCGSTGTSIAHSIPDTSNVASSNHGGPSPHCNSMSTSPIAELNISDSHNSNPDIHCAMSPLGGELLNNHMMKRSDQVAFNNQAGEQRDNRVVAPVVLQAAVVGMGMGVGVVPVASPVQQEDEQIMFGSVDQIGMPAGHGMMMAPHHPQALFEDREFDFFQDDLLGLPHVDPAVVCAGAASMPQGTPVPIAVAPVVAHADSVNVGSQNQGTQPVVAQSQKNASPSHTMHFPQPGFHPQAHIVQQQFHGQVGSTKPSETNTPVESNNNSNSSIELPRDASSRKTSPPPHSHNQNNDYQNNTRQSRHDDNNQKFHRMNGNGHHGYGQRGNWNSRGNYGNQQERRDRNSNSYSNGYSGGNSRQYNGSHNGSRNGGYTPRNRGGAAAGNGVSGEIQRVLKSSKAT